jgi:F0F1-type ATP synthase membrane subunit c/vacuolar-type H+-ATPase subunit K
MSDLVQVDASWARGDVGAQRDQLKLIYDYVKFHIQLYLATPAVLVLVADGFGVKGDPIFFAALVAALACFVSAGISAGLFMGTHVNVKWGDAYLKTFADGAFKWQRRAAHHWVYWAGLGVGLVGIGASLVHHHCCR